MVSRKKNPVLEFLSRFWGPMPWLLELAIALSIFLGHDLEAVIIAILIVTNAIIGYLHSRSSQKSLELLKERLAVNAVARREGTWVTKNASEIVPGDIVVVQMGDIVPADAKMLSGALSVDQSALTGESLPVEVGPSEILYSSSVVKRGEAQCLVVNTGGNTYFGRTAELVQTARPKSHQEQIMLSIVRYMMYLGIAALAAVAVGAFLLKIGILAVVTFAVIFLMGAVPVALPAVLTIVQAVGAMELVRKGVLVTRLDSMEDAASLDVLCLDKTGTLTMNQLSVTEVIPYGGHEVNDVLATAALTAKPESKDGIDAAVREKALAAGDQQREIPPDFGHALRACHQAFRGARPGGGRTLSGSEGRTPGGALPLSAYRQRRGEGRRGDGGNPVSQGVQDPGGGKIPLRGRGRPGAGRASGHG